MTSSETTDSIFEAETAVRRLDDNTWSAQVSSSWNIGDNPNGGYLVAIALQALRQLTSHRDPISVTTHFLRPASGGLSAQIVTDVIRTGRTLTTVRATLSQDGKDRLVVLAALSDLSERSADGSPASDPPAHAISMAMPSIPPPESCPVRSGVEQGIELPILDGLDVRIHPDQAAAGQAGTAATSGWIRLADGSAPDVCSLLVFADAFPPSLFGLLGVVGWVPTVELTVHVRRRPVSGWILGEFSTSDLHDGRMIESGALWDESGALVAQSRQIGLLLT